MLPRRRSRGSRSSPTRTGCATTPPSACAASTGSARTASAPATTASTTTASRSARRSIQRLRRELLDAERQAVVALRNEGTITEEVMQRVQRDIDLEDSRLDV